MASRAYWHVLLVLLVLLGLLAVLAVREKHFAPEIAVYLVITEGGHLRMHGKLGSVELGGSRSLNLDFVGSLRLRPETDVLAEPCRQFLGRLGLIRARGAGGREAEVEVRRLRGIDRRADERRRGNLRRALCITVMASRRKRSYSSQTRTSWWTPSL